MKRNKGMILAFMTPAVVMFILVFLYPIIRTILMSFQDRRNHGFHVKMDLHRN